MIQQSILHQLKFAAENFPKRPALFSETKLIANHFELYSNTCKIRYLLHKQYGISKVDRVALCFPNGSSMAKALLAVSTSAIAVPMNPKFTEAEFEAYFLRTGTTQLIYDQEYGHPAATIARRLGIPNLEFRSLERFSYKLNEDFSDLEAFPEAEDVALILMTSGSTGMPKTVPLTHKNICQSVFDITKSLELSEQDRCLCMWKQFHIGGLVDLLLAPISQGGCVLAAHQFDVSTFFRIIKDWSATWFQGVPTIYSDILFEAEQKSLSGTYPCLRFLRSVAARLEPDLQEKLSNYFYVPVIQTYGMTEAGPLISSTDLGGTSPIGSVGKSTGTEIRIIDEKNNDCLPNEIGAIAIRGANVFKSYENDPQANASSFLDGWFLTGDLGNLDKSGHLFLNGRSKDLVNRGGEKINPEEVESALRQHPQIKEVSVFSIPHSTLGEDVAAAIVYNQQNSLSRSDISLFLSDHIAEFKIPRFILELKKLPRNAIGKIDKEALRAKAEKYKKKDSVVVLPKTPIEKAIVRIWIEVLEIEQICIHDNFFDLGGNSLLAIRAQSRIRDIFEVDIPLRELFEFPTIEKLAGQIETLCFTDAIGQEREQGAL